MSLETMTSKEKNMQSSNVKDQIPLKILGNKGRVLQMEMKLISSTPIRNSEKRNMVNESFQVGSPILRVNSSQINENKSKEVVPANANSSVKSNSLESKNLNNPKTAPYHMILYSSDEDAKVITRKKLRKKMTKKRRLVPLVEDTDSEISPKHTKTNVDLAENNHTDKVANGKENNEHEKLINTRETNTNKRGANEKRIEDINSNKKAKRKYTKKTKTEDLITVQRSEVETEAVMCEEVVNKAVLDTGMSPQNKLNNVLKAKNSVTKTLQLIVSDNEIDRPENEKKPKLQSNKNAIFVLKDKQSQDDNPKKVSKRKTKLNDVEQNLRRNDNDEVKEISQGSSNGARQSSRRRLVSQKYWIARSNSQSSDYAETNNLPKNTEEQFSKKKQPKTVPSKKKITRTRQQKPTKEIITTISTNPDNVQANGADNPEEHKSNKPTRNPNSDLDSCNNDVQTEANNINENETKSKPVKQNKKTMPADSKKQTRSALDVQKQLESNTSPIDTDGNSDNIPSDSLTADLHEDKFAKSGSNTAESIIDNYSFKEIALAQRHLAEIENSKQPEYFGKFPQTYHTHSNNPNLSIGINISNPNFISGVLEIVPSGRKQEEYPKKNNMSFFILEGYAEVCVGKISKILRIGDSFFVPNNTPYYIINLNKTKRLLILFTKHVAT